MRINRAVDLERFCDFLRAVHVLVHEVEGAIVSASVPGAASALHERREMSGYVTTWNALNPGSLVELADQSI
jgi:hypothetical protein